LKELLKQFLGESPLPFIVMKVYGLFGLSQEKNPPSIKTAGYGYLFNLLEAHLYAHGSGEIALKLTSSKSRIAGYISNVNVGLNILKTVIG